MAILGGDANMPIVYKKDILPALRDAGYSQNRLRLERIMGQATITQLRHGNLVSWKNIEILCRLLHCQPGDILEYQEENPQDQQQEGAAT